LITVKLSCVWLSVDSSFVWQLPTEGFKLEQMNSNLRVKWFNQAANKATLALPEGLTSCCYRSEAATAAKKLGLKLLPCANLLIGMRLVLLSRRDIGKVL
jgi:hypothetical protein